MAPSDWLKRLFGSRPAPSRPAEPEQDSAQASNDSDDDSGSSGDDSGSSDDDSDDPSRAQANEKRDRALEAEARALFDAGDAGAGIALLAARAIMFAKHVQDGLPCLCRRCVKPALDRAEFGGIEFARDFVICEHRVLLYWMPAELLADAKRVRSSMRGRVKQRLHARRRRVKKSRQGINPFTGKVIW